MLDYALKYASRGWSVFPLTGKRPLTEHGLKDATTSPETIRAWWQRWPSANVGIACGVSGLCVVDVDVKNGANGWESWRDLLAKLGLSEPDTLTCETPSGGGHVYFETQEPLRPSVGKLGPGLDVRAGASYVVAPPSKGYGWAMGCDLDRVALLPEPLAKEIQKNPAFEPSEAMSGMAIGARNVSLTRMAGALRRQGLDRDGLLSALQAINEAQCTPPLLSEEVARIAQSVAQYDPAPEHLTDLGNARRLVKRHGQDVRYCGPLGGWLVWDGKRWTVDATGAIERMAKETVAAMYDQAGQLTDQDERARLAGWAIKSESAQRIRAMIELARTEPGIMVKPEVFDCDPWLLNVDNGTVDLKTGQLREHNRADMIPNLRPWPMTRPPPTKC